MMYKIRFATITLAVISIMGLSTVSATVLRREYSLDADEVISRYKTECAGGDLTTDLCKSQRRDLEEIYFMVFRRMTASREKGAVHRKYILKAAQAQEFQALKEIGLWTLDHEGNLSDDEKQLFVAELNSPYSSLRKIAWSTLLKPTVSGSHFDETTLGVDRSYRGIFGKVEHGAPRGMLADRHPAAEWMMVPPFPEGKILFYASGKGGAVYETQSPISEVLAFYEKKGLETISYKNQLLQLNTVQSAKWQELTAKMMSGADPTAIAAEMETLQQTTKNLMPQWLPYAKDLVLVGESIEISGHATVKPYAAIWTHPTLNTVGIAIPYNQDIWGR